MLFRSALYSADICLQSIQHVWRGQAWRKEILDLLRGCGTVVAVHHRIHCISVQITVQEKRWWKLGELLLMTEFSSYYVIVAHVALLFKGNSVSPHN